MAKQTGDIIIEGTIDDITFYKMEGKGYARKKSSLTGKRVKKDPRFKRTMQSAERMAKGSQLASNVYRSLPRQEQVYALFKELKSRAVLMLKEGKGEEEVLVFLQQQVGKAGAPETPAADKKHKTPRVYTTSSFTKPLFRVRGRRKEKRLVRRRRIPAQPAAVIRE